MMLSVRLSFATCTGPRSSSLSFSEISSARAENGLSKGAVRGASAFSREIFSGGAAGRSGGLR